MKAPNPWHANIKHVHDIYNLSSLDNLKSEIGVQQKGKDYAVNLSFPFA